MERPSVVFGEKASDGMVRGASQLAHLLGLTLGPAQGHVLLAKDTGSERYECINDGATAARRIIALPNATEDVGAMLLRQLAWRMRQRVGDGSATAAVLAQSMLADGQRFIAAGANPMLLRKGMELGVAAAAQAIQGMTEPLAGQERMAALATAACGDPELGKIVGEIFETLGPEGVVNIQEYMGPYLDREYIEGSRFRGTFTSRFFLTDEKHRLIQLERPYIFVCDWHLSEVAQVQPLLELVLRQGEGRPLLVVSASQEGAALAALLANHQKGVLQCAGVTLRGVGDEWRAALDDLALITGGRFIVRDAALAPKDITLADLGQAARVEVDEDYTTIFEGAGDRKAVRRRVLALREQLAQANDMDEAQKLRERLGRLGSGIAILKIGAVTKMDRERRRAQAEEAVRVVAAAQQGGVVPGGGAAFLAAVPAVRAVAAEGDVALGVSIIARALEEPMRRIAANAGCEGTVAVARAKACGPQYAFEVRSGEVADMCAAGILDSSTVVRTALEMAASMAAMVLTTGAIVLHRKPETSVEP